MPRRRRDQGCQNLWWAWLNLLDLVEWLIRAQLLVEVLLKVGSHRSIDEYCAVQLHQTIRRILESEDRFERRKHSQGVALLQQVAGIRATNQLRDE